MFVVLEHPYILYLNLLAKSPFLGKGFYFIRFYQIKNADVTIGGCSLAEEPFGMSVVVTKRCSCTAVSPRVPRSILPFIIVKQINKGH